MHTYTSRDNGRTRFICIYANAILPDRTESKSRRILCAAY